MQFVSYARSPLSVNVLLKASWFLVQAAVLIMVEDDGLGRWSRTMCLFFIVAVISFSGFRFSLYLRRTCPAKNDFDDGLLMKANLFELAKCCDILFLEKLAFHSKVGNTNLLCCLALERSLWVWISSKLKVSIWKWFSGELGIRKRISLEYVRSSKSSLIKTSKIALVRKRN